jgi:protein-S-isoprenylcysteine O-methyltransferase Ste14
MNNAFTLAKGKADTGLGWSNDLRCVEAANALIRVHRATGLLLFLCSLTFLRKSFRVGIDRPHRLIIDGPFAYSRNPIYVAFAIILIGEFLIFSNWVTLIYLGAATWLLHRQVVREEDYLNGHYGQAYEEYRRRVRRYF